jgi:hypothetical protein
MIPGGWTELAVWRGMAQLSRAAERERLARLVRSERRVSEARRAGSVPWHRWVGQTAAVRIRLRHRPPSGCLQSLTRGDRS